MSDIAICVEHLSKRYRLGTREPYKTLRDSLADVASVPFRAMASLRRAANRGQSPNGCIWALKDVSLQIKRGEVIGIVGRNGAGKSTLLKILARITDPTEGCAEIHGRVGSLLEVGTGFHPELTGRENIYLNGAILGMKKTEIAHKFDEIVAFAEVEKFLDTPVKHYSSGMYVRLAFSVAAHMESEILLVDEVLAVGDAEFQKKCLGKMGDVAQQGRTVLFVSHNMGVITRLCPRAVLIARGALVQDGPAEATVSHYLAMNANTLGKVSWDNGIANPNVNEIAIMQVSLLDANDNTITYVDNSQSIFLEIRYKIFETLDFARIGFRLSGADGTPILEAYDIDRATQSRTRAPGSYVLKCEIPGRLLCPGSYFLSIGAGIPGTKNLVLLDGILMLHVDDAGPNALAAPVQGQRSGFINPQLIKWESREL